MAQQTEQLMTVSLVEVRAWARASRNLAEKEGFTRTAKAIDEYIDQLNEWQNEGTCTVTIHPWKVGEER